MFKFNLEVLHKVRKLKKDKIIKTWTAEVEMLNHLVREKNNLVESHNDYKKKYVSSLNEGNQARTLILKNYIDTFKERFRQSQVKIDEQQQKMSHLREQVLSVSRDFEIIEKLKEKKYQAYLQEKEKREIKQNEELIVLRSKRGNKIGSI